MVKKQINFRGNPDTIVQLTIGDLDDLVYKASYRASNKAVNSLYKGLVKAFLDRFDQDHSILIDEMEQIRIRLNSIQCKGDNNND